MVAKTIKCDDEKCKNCSEKNECEEIKKIGINFIEKSLEIANKMLENINNKYTFPEQLFAVVLIFKNFLKDVPEPLIEDCIKTTLNTCITDFLHTFPPKVAIAIHEIKKEEE